jgi:hypothetical protein
MLDLKKGRIYLYKGSNFESLFLIETLWANGTALFCELATDFQISITVFKLRKEIYSKNIVKEVLLEDLPLYIYMPEKSPEFLDLIKRGCP